MENNGNTTISNERFLDLLEKEKKIKNGEIEFYIVNDFSGSAYAGNRHYEFFPNSEKYGFVLEAEEDVYKRITKFFNDKLKFFNKKQEKYLKNLEKLEDDKTNIKQQNKELNYKIEILEKENQILKENNSSLKNKIIKLEKGKFFLFK